MMLPALIPDATPQRTASLKVFGARSTLHLADCVAWMGQQGENLVHAIVTDPPYGFKEYTAIEKQKLRSRRGGVWRIPPSFNGCVRAPVPRFTVLTRDDRDHLDSFFSLFAEQAFKILAPGGASVHSKQPLTFPSGLSAFDEGRIREARRGYQAGADPARRRQAEECA